MKRVYLCCCVYLLSLALGLYAMAYEDGSAYEAGRVVIKIGSAHRGSLQLTERSTGIASLDEKLRTLGSYRLAPRFITNPLLRQAQLPDLSGILELSFDPSLSVWAVINSLQRDPNILYAEPIWIDEAFDSPNDTNYPSSLYFASLDAEAAWDIHKGELGTNPVILAVVDTGARWTHPDLVENIWQNLGEDANANGYTMYYNGSAWVMDPGDLNGIDDDGNGFVDDLIGWDFMLDALGNQANDPFESSGHGTNVSGIANSRTNNAMGVASLAWNVILMPISCSHPGAPSSIYRGYDAIIYAAENGAQVINCSWGGTSYSQANQEAVNYAWALGAVIVAAGGNSNNSTPIYPAGYQNVVAVAAVMNDGSKSSVSNFGAYLSVAAPTEAVGTTSGTSYSLVSTFTSYASPIASSLAALIRSYQPTWTNAQVVNQLVATCDNIDLMNPGKEKALGQGKLNAHRALAETDPLPIQELKLALLEQRPPSDQNGNKAIEPGESFSMNLSLRNYAYGAASSNVTYQLTSADPAVSILNGTHTGSIAADSYVYLDEVFSILVSPTASSKYVSFNLSVTADIPITFGSSLNFSVLINGGGIYVWEGVASARNMSGAYIRNRLQSLGHQTTYGTVFPSSFHGFEAVFLSFGTVGSSISRFDSFARYEAVREYLEAGGKLYMEGGDAVGYDLGAYLPDVGGGQSAADVLYPLLGIASAEDGITNPIDDLNALEGWIAYPISFSASNQTQNQYIDLFVPTDQAFPALVESGYGTVAVEHRGSYGQRSFVFSYALAELVDGAFPHTKAELLNRILDFFLSTDPPQPQILSLSPAGEIVFPLFMQGESSGGENNSRLPHAFRLKLTGLAADAGYRYRMQAVKETDSKLFSGYGIPIYISSSGDYVYGENPDLESNFGSFITDALGNYEGWFILEATGDQHFSSGSELKLRLLLNDGAGGSKPVTFITGSSSLQTLGFGSAALPQLGTGLYGDSYASAKDLVFVYDNPEGLGRPIAGSSIESSGLDYGQAWYPQFYRDFVAANDGAWGLIIPNAYSSKAFGGIKRIEARDIATGEIVAFNTDEDGIWHSGANTVNPSGGLDSPIYISPVDATLPVVLSSFTAIAYGEGAARLAWITQSETNLAGFRIYRAMNAELSSALLVSGLIPAMGGSSPASYVFTDAELEGYSTYYYWLESASLDGSSEYYGYVTVQQTEPPDLSPHVPLFTELKAAFPNPFNPSTTISYSLAEACTASLEIYNLRGERVKSYSRTHSEPGNFSIVWDGRDERGQSLATGLYFYRLIAGTYSATRKALLVK